MKGVLVLAVTAQMSILGFYNYDNSVLDGLLDSLPSPKKVPKEDYFYPGDEINKDNFLALLFSECAELEIAITDYEILKKMITAWSETKEKQWQSLYNTMYYKYNPIWNKDGKIVRTETETRNLQEDFASKEKSTEEKDSSFQSIDTRNLTNTETRDIQETAIPDTNKTITVSVSAYNDNDFQNKDRTSETVSGTSTVTNTGTVTNTDSGTLENTTSGSGNNNISKDSTENRTNTGTVTKEYIDSETGNIGVTTTQKMIQEERELVANFNICELIVNDFKYKFCILVY